MNAESSNDDGQLIRDSPTLPEEEPSGNVTKEDGDESMDQFNKNEGQSGPHEHHLMTTQELQLYWKKEKHEGKPVKLLFEIQSTRIAEDFLSKFVVYQIVIIKTGSFDGTKAFIERRYSDFERLHRNLLKDFQDDMEDVLFPKKVLMGNLTQEMINKRMLALKYYLEELYAIRCVRKSRKFIDFFIHPELEDGYSCVRGGQYGKAIETFQQVVYLQEKLAPHYPSFMVPSLCALVVCHKDMDQSGKAYEFGLRALELLEKHTGHKYYIPLLDTLISLAYKQGKDFVTLQEKLQKAERKMNRGFEHNMFTVKELVVQESVQREK
ncbi:sorting nexin-20 [Pseudophryne corroboree]|uniref:sorting nexin-20 n=1 Tax=Pseudophryne corroboree TaxID=495146 RepID=UPI00308206BF